MDLSKLKSGIKHILHLDEPPHELAKSFAVGVLVAFSPLLGLHTIIILLLAWALRLNKVVALSGTFINNPWTIPVVYIGPTWITVIAMRYLGFDVPRMNFYLLHSQFVSVASRYTVWQPIFWRSFIKALRPFILAFVIGTFLAGVTTSIMAYFFAFFGINYYRRKRSRRQVAQVPAPQQVE